MEEVPIINEEEESPLVVVVEERSDATSLSVEVDGHPG